MKINNKVLVTGGAGYVGSNLINKLLIIYPNIQITSLDCYSSGSKSNHVDSNQVRYIEGYTWDIKSIFSDEKFDIIYHFGEYSRIVNSFDDFEFVSKSIVEGTLEVLKFVLNTKARLIYSASSSKFGNNGKDENLSPYAFFKSKNVELIKNLGDWFNLEYSICYFFNVYGRNHIKTGDYATVIAIFEEQFKNKETLTVVSPGTQSRDFTHIDDICSGLIKATEKNIRAEYHLRFGKNFQIIDVAKIFSEKITYIKERRGERFTSEFFSSNTNETLNWYPKINLMDYINDFKKIVNNK